jgi:glucose-6-phosphate isomerase
MENISFDYSNAAAFFAQHELQFIENQVVAAEKLLESRRGPGNEFLGWLDLPSKYDRAEFRRIQAAAKKIQRQSEVLIVIGIGGSYLGSKAAIEFCGHAFHNNLSKKNRKNLGLGVEVYFAGTNLSGSYLRHLLDVIGDRDFSLNVISKSGTTTEPALAFRILKKHLEAKYGKELARERIYATTDKSRGALKKLADSEGYETFVVPDDVGGRFSVLTAVGLLPMAAQGIDIQQVMLGAAAGKTAAKASFSENEALKYVALRNILHRKGKSVELLVNYEPCLHFVAEWWKQLFGESEGKDQKGIFTASADFTTDLHSLGQFVQDGARIFFETVLEIGHSKHDFIIESEPNDPDGLNYLTGKNLHFVNKMAQIGTTEAHVSGGVPNLIIRIPEATPYYLGQLFFFFEKACAVSGYVLGVNPFDQPGVEAYKTNMFRLLGKPN